MKRFAGFSLALIMLLSFVGAYIAPVRSVADTAYYNSLINMGFPSSYATKIEELHNLHPSWKFEPVMITELSRTSKYTSYKSAYTWEYVIDQEYAYSENIVSTSSWAPEPYASLGVGNYTPYYDPYNTTLYDSGKRLASRQAQEYFIDPRNWLNDTEVFMFKTVVFDPDVDTVEGTNAIFAGTFMGDYADCGNGTSYAQYLYDCGQEYGVSSLALASRLRGEQGAGTSPQIHGTLGDVLYMFATQKPNSYNGATVWGSNWTASNVVSKLNSLGYSVESLKSFNGYYNFFNIQASGTGYFEIYFNAVMEAIEGGWNTKAKAIDGGARKFAEKYVNCHQDTAYFQKFNLDPRASRDGTSSANFWAQWMQGISGALTEARSMRTAYEEDNSLESAFTFLVPVFEGMPASCPDPAGGNVYWSNKNNTTQTSFTITLNQDPHCEVYFDGGATSKVATVGSTVRINFKPTGGYAVKSVNASGFRIPVSNGGGAFSYDYQVPASNVTVKVSTSQGEKFIFNDAFADCQFWELNGYDGNYTSDACWQTTRPSNGEPNWVHMAFDDVNTTMYPYCAVFGESDSAGVMGFYVDEGPLTGDRPFNAGPVVITGIPTNTYNSSMSYINLPFYGDCTTFYYNKILFYKDEAALNDFLKDTGKWVIDAATTPNGTLTKVGDDYTADLTADSTTITVSGWEASRSKIENFGYRINGSEPVYSTSFKAAPESAVIQAGSGNVGRTGEAMRFRVQVPVTSVTTKIEILAKMAAFDEPVVITTINISNGDYKTASSRDSVFFSGESAVATNCGETMTLSFENKSGKTINFAGWLGADKTISSFGYSVDNGAYTTKNSYRNSAEAAVIAATNSVTGGVSGRAYRFNVSLPVSEGTHTIGIYAKLSGLTRPVLIWAVTYTDTEEGAAELIISDTDKAEKVNDLIIINEGVSGETLASYFENTGLKITNVPGATNIASGATIEAPDGVYYVYLRGDVNSDGVVNADDAAHFMKHVLNSAYTVPVEDDFDGDGNVSYKDASAILKHLFNSSYTFAEIGDVSYLG